MSHTKKEFDDAMKIDAMMKEITEIHGSETPTLLFTVLSGMAHRDGVNRESFLKLAAKMYDLGTEYDNETDKGKS